ncbi:MAG: fibronectin type III domain-containing protein, partial [Candidatus Nanopelagicales bacterium]
MPNTFTGVRPGDTFTITNGDPKDVKIWGGPSLAPPDYTAVITNNKTGNQCTASKPCEMFTSNSYTFTVERAGTVLGQGTNLTQLTLQGVNPTPPRDVTATPGDASATVTWLAPDDTRGLPIAEYRVLSIPGAKECETSGALSCTVTGLTNGTAYFFRVIATNTVGGYETSAASNTVTPIGPLPAPSPTTSWDAAAGELTVSWSPYDWAGNTPQSFDVQRRVNGQPWTSVALPNPLAETIVQG